MLTRNRKKRKAGNDKSCPQNSNQKYTPVPRDDAPKVGEMMTMDHGGTSGSLEDDCQGADYLQVAWLLREKLNDLVDGDKGEFPGSELCSLLEMAASRNIVSVDPKMLNPVLWRTLPKGLLLLVFARLPLPDITRLSCLSRAWRKAMATVNSSMNQACDEASPTMIAGFSSKHIMCEGSPHSEFLVTICDLSTHRSPYSHRLHPGNPGDVQWDDMGARDGGLVCFVSTWKPSKANPLCIVVVNLLTRVRLKLPPLQYVYLSPPQMMHIEVDAETKCYRVVFIGKNIKGCPTVEIYDSGARQWAKATPPSGSILGLAHRWEYSKFHSSFRSTRPTRSVYDFAKGQLKRCDEKDPSRGASVITYELQKDCKFVLHRKTSNGEISQAEGFCITKYRMQKNAKDWVQERSYLCSPFEALLKEFHWSQWKLEACEGFLMVFPYSSGSCGHFWLLDLSSGEWSSLPNCFQEHEYDVLMSRAFWNVVP